MNRNLQKTLHRTAWFPNFYLRARFVGVHAFTVGVVLLGGLLVQTSCAPPNATETAPKASGPQATAPKATAPKASGPEAIVPQESPQPKMPALTISAAASTKEIMEALATEFTQQHKTEVQINPGPSSNLATQILAGAPVDLFLSANRQWAEKVQAEGKVQAMAPLLSNRLVLVVPKANPAGITKLEHLANDRLKKLALAGEKVPAGQYADQALTKLNLLEELSKQGKIARGQDVRSALSYVERGEAEAGIVYATDVAAASGVVIACEFDPALHDEIVYVLVLLKREEASPAAQQYYEFLQSPAADALYTKFGFTRSK